LFHSKRYDLCAGGLLFSRIIKTRHSTLPEFIFTFKLYTHVLKAHVCSNNYHFIDIGLMRPNKRNLRRRKRQTNSGRKYLEVLIVADTSVTAIVGKNKLETYLLTLMNIVSRILNYPKTLNCHSWRHCLAQIQIERNNATTGDQWIETHKWMNNTCTTQCIYFDTNVFLQVNSVYKHETLSADIEVVTVKAVEMEKQTVTNLIHSR
jgi:hypothetical protein